MPGDEIDKVKVIDFGNAIEDCVEEKQLYFGDFQLQVCEVSYLDTDFDSDVT